MRIATIIAVSTYTGGFSNKISAAVKADSAAIRSLFTSLGMRVDSEVGSDGSPVSYFDIKSAIATALTSASADDDVVIYYTGHGLESEGLAYFVPSEANPDLKALLSYLVPLSFPEEIADTLAKSLTFIVDACRTGNLRGASSTGPNVRPLTHPDNNGKWVTYILATGAGDIARSVDGDEPMSVFSRVMCDVLPTLHVDSRIIDVERQMKSRQKELCEELGMPEQRLEITTSGDKRFMSLPLFSIEAPTESSDLWTRKLASIGLTTVLPNSNRPDVSADKQTSEILALIDRYEYEAPDMMPDANGTESAWQDGALLARLAESLMLVKDSVSQPFEWAALLGVVGAAEASFREAEAQLLRPMNHTGAARSVLASEPTLDRAIRSARSDEAQSLKSWLCHLAAIRESISLRHGNLSGKLGEIARVLLPVTKSEDAIRVSKTLLKVVRSAFDSATTLGDDEGFIELRPGDSFHTLNCKRLAALLQVTWLLALDSRLFPADAGLNIIRDDVDLRESVASLRTAEWVRAGNIIDLSLRTRSAALDSAVRDLAAEISILLLAHSQLGSPLEGSDLPLTAVTTRMKPEDKAFRVPHISFSISPSETQQLLFGTELYRDTGLAIRELYQNAVDACHHREQRMRHLAQGTSSVKSLIRFSTGEDQRGSYVECTDNGIGMSEHELREAFSRAGRRFRDLPEYIEEADAWAAAGEPVFVPISQFGIGVLSYFMIAETMELWTTRTKLSGGFSLPLHVTVHGSGGVFRVQHAEEYLPLGGGTTIRLYLREDAASLDLGSTLAHILRAPQVSVEMSDNGRHMSWSRYQLYWEYGQDINVMPGSRTNNAWFHQGRGSILVNGIPAECDRVIMGFTISLDATHGVKLSMDRRALLDWNIESALRDACRAVPSRISWSGASINWLRSVFDTDTKLGRAVLEAAGDDSWDLFDEGDPPRQIVIAVNPVRQGFYMRDPDILVARARELTELDYFRLRRLGRPVAGPERSFNGNGFPSFDGTLATLMSAPGKLNHIWLRETYRGDYPARSNNNGRWRTLAEELVETADALGVNLGAAVIYAWAARFASDPAPLWLHASGARWTATRNPHEWKSLYTSSTLSKTPLIGWNVAETVSIWFQVISETTDQALAAELTPLYTWFTSILNEVAPDDEIRRWAVVADTTDGLRGSRNEDIPKDFRDSALAVFRRLAGNRNPENWEREGRSPRAVKLPPDVQAYSAAALAAVSVNLDAEPPFIVGDLPALNVALAAHEMGSASEPLAAELEELGYVVVPQDTGWAALDRLVHKWGEWIAELGLDDIENLDPEDFSTLSSMLGLEKFIDLCRDITDAGVGGRVSRAFSNAPYQPNFSTHRHAEALPTSSFMDMKLGPAELARAAQTFGVTYGETFDELLFYRETVESWNLPDVLPENVRCLRPNTTELQFYAAHKNHDLMKNSGAQWLVRALRSSAISGESLPEILEAVAPLLEACGAQLAMFRQVAHRVQREIYFDDLMVIATQQFIPPISDPREAVEFCRPFAHEAHLLSERVELWLGLPVQTLSEAWVASWDS